MVGLHGDIRKKNNISKILSITYTAITCMCFTCCREIGRRSTRISSTPYNGKKKSISHTLAHV